MNRIPAVTAKTMSEIGSARIRRQAIQRKSKRKKTRRNTPGHLIPEDESPQHLRQGMNTTDDATDTTSRTTVETNNGNETHAHTTRIPHAQQRKPAMSYVLYFSKPFARAIAIWPFLSLLLTLPVQAHIRAECTELQPARIYFAVFRCAVAAYIRAPV